ncbi:MAG: LVIVD repeat-containing protein, partial [Candidatus Hodarchaeales archaeon]
KKINCSKFTIYIIIILLFVLPCSKLTNAKFFSNDLIFEINFLGRISTGGDSYDVQVFGDIAYVTCGYQGLKIFNVSDPTNLVQLGSLAEGMYSWQGYAHQFYMDFPLMYIGDGTGGLNIVNVSDPTNPRSISHYTDFYSWDVQILENLGSKIAFVGNGFQADENSGLTIINVTNPANPVLIHHILTGGDVTDLKLVDNYIILMDGISGLVIIDISNYTNPEILDQVSINENMGAHEVLGDLVYAVNYQEGLKIFNISNPSDIILVSEFNESLSSTWDVKIDPETNLAFVIDTELGLKVVNVSNPMQPVLIAEFSDDSLRYNNVFYTEDRIYLDTNFGLTILDYKIKEKGLTTVSNDTTTISSESSISSESITVTSNDTVTLLTTIISDSETSNLLILPFLVTLIVLTLFRRKRCK